MVGVPRSKGCQTCLRRRVKCNEERPTCLQCRKSGYQCAGYNKERPTRPQTIKVGPIESAVILHMKDRARETTAEELVVLASEFLEITCPREIDLSAFEEKFMVTCLFTNYVHGNFGSPWLDLSAAGKLGLTSRIATLAVASEFFALHHEQPKFTPVGVELYGNSLRLMRKELADKDNACAENFIVPIMVMITYDFLTWKDGLSCDHFHGLSRVVQLCGPKRFREEPYMSSFETARDLLIMLSLHDQRRSFLESREWKTEPWALDPAKKGPVSGLLDILADVPGLLEDQMAAVISNDAPETDCLRQRVLAHLSQLYQWRWAWEEANPNAVSEEDVVLLYPDPEEKDDNSEEDTHQISPPVPQRTTTHITQIKYQPYSLANEIALYNAIQLYLLRILLDTGGIALPDTSDFFSSHVSRAQAQRDSSSSSPLSLLPVILLLPGEATTLRSIALEIVRSFASQLAAFHEIKDSLVAWVLPMGLAWQILRRQTNQQRLGQGEEQVQKEEGKEGDTQAGFGVLIWEHQARKLVESAPFALRNTVQFVQDSIRLV